MAVNVCWTFGYGNREDYDLADRFESRKVYMMLLLKLKKF